MLADGGITKQNSSNNIPAMAQAVTFIGAKVFCISKYFKNFIAKIIIGPDENNDYEVKFLKRSSKVNNGLIFPEKEELASISHDDIVCGLPLSQPVARTARWSGIFKFLFEATSCEV